MSSIGPLPSVEFVGFLRLVVFAPWIAPSWSGRGGGPADLAVVCLRIGDSQCGRQRFRGLRVGFWRPARCWRTRGVRLRRPTGRPRSGPVLAACSASAAARTRTVSASSGCVGRSRPRPRGSRRRGRSARRGGSAPPRWRGAAISGAAPGRGGGWRARDSGRELGQRVARRGGPHPAPRPPAAHLGMRASADKRASRISAVARRRGRRGASSRSSRASGDVGVVQAAGEDRALADARLDARVVGGAGEQRGRGRRRRRGCRRAGRGRRPGAARGSGAGRARARRRREERGAAGADLGLPVGAERRRRRCGRGGRAGGRRARRGARGCRGPAPSVSRVQSRSTIGREASRSGCIAAAPPARTTSSGSWPGGISAKRSERPGPR